MITPTCSFSICPYRELHTIGYKLMFRMILYNNHHSAGTDPVFCKLRCTTQGSQPSGAAPKLKSIMALVFTGTLRVVLWKLITKQLKNW